MLDEILSVFTLLKELFSVIVEGLYSSFLDGNAILAVIAFAAILIVFGNFTGNKPKR